MPTFTQIPSDDPIREVIKAAFDTNLSLEGGWGYTQESATVITSLPQGVQLAQLEHIFASMRAYLEMNMTLPMPERYGSINVNEKTRTTEKINGKHYHHVIYEITAMKEETYATFIEEYKEGYGKESFDIEAHFQRRKDATLRREVTHWFNIDGVE